MGGKSGRPVLVLSPAKLAQVDATIKADIDKKVTDPIINTALKNNLGLAQKTLSRACKMMDFHAYKIVTSPARGGEGADLASMLLQGMAGAPRGGEGQHGLQR